MPVSTAEPGLAGARVPFDGDDPNWAIAAKQPAATTSVTQPVRSSVEPPTTVLRKCFVPREPKNFREAGLREPQVEALVLKFLLNSGGNTGREIAQQIALPFGIVEPLLRKLKQEQLVVYRDGTVIGDYSYELTLRGAERARSHAAQSTYFGSAPVPLEYYTASVEVQSCRHEKPTMRDVQATFSSLVLDESIQRQVGEAVNLGLGFFLHGPPGNGKTSIAEQVTRIYSNGIWIPRAIEAGGEIIRVFDPTKHEPLEWKEERDIHEDRIDARWIFIKRPTILVGGELRMENLEVATNGVTGISEAPLQLKANCGTLVIDDFGRQKFRIDELLNRLIIPLERRGDVLNLPSGRSFNIPFDVLIVFSTNLAPESLVDEAFLRRVPFTIHAPDPTVEQFKEVFLRTARKFGLQCESSQVDYLLETHYRQEDRPLRFCHPRDILQQIANSCDFAGSARVVTHENIQHALRNCLAIRVD